MRLLDRLSAVARNRRMSDATVDAYSSWIRSYLSFSAARKGQWTAPEQLHTADVEAFLNHLVLEKRLSASSQNQALNALVFLYQHVLEDAIPQDHLGKFVLLRSKRKKRIPTVLSVAEVTLLLRSIEAPKYQLMAKLLYGTGLRIAECCTLRVRDIDLGRGQMIVREGKGDKDRVVMLPESLRDELVAHLSGVESTWRGIRSALFSLSYLALKRGGAKDWFTGLGLSLTHQGRLHFIQFHHIFAKALLQDAGYDKSEINEIANMAFITGQTNRKLSKTPPEKYFADIINERGEQAVRDQQIPLDRSLWKIERYRDFLAERRKLLAEAINRFIDDAARTGRAMPVAGG